MRFFRGLFGILSSLWRFFGALKILEGSVELFWAISGFFGILSAFDHFLRNLQDSLGFFDSIELFFYSQYFNISLTNKNHHLSYFTFLLLLLLLLFAGCCWRRFILNSRTWRLPFFSFLIIKICIQISNIEIHKVCVLVDHISAHFMQDAVRRFHRRLLFFPLEFHLLLKTQSQGKTRVQLPLVICCQKSKTIHKNPTYPTGAL